jgi:hypothetical protein
MIKVESDMLVLDSSFTKEDALAINQFVEIIKRQERERIVKLLENIYDYPQEWDYDNPIESLISIIKGANK